MPKKPIHEQFTDEEMEQMKRHGAAQIGGSDFSAKVEEHLNALEEKREANAKKMQAAQTGGATDPSLAPSQMDQAQVKQRGAMDQNAALQAAQKAQQAQAAQTPVNAPPAPTGPAGTTSSFPAQQGDVGGGGNLQQPAAQQTQPTPPPGGPPPEEGEEDPATQFPS